MEDDEEILSDPSPETRSPPSPGSNGRITVTVAAAPPPPHSLALALPIQQPRAVGNGSGTVVGGGREDCWSEGATSVLIDAWGERYLELSRGNLKQKHWKEVADIVSSREDYSKTPKTDVQCKNRIDTVKKKYKLEKSKISTGGGPSRWLFFDRLDHLIGPMSKLGSGSYPTPMPSSQSKVPVGIPVGVRSNRVQNLKQKKKSRRRDLTDSDSEPEPPSPDSTDSLPPETYKRARTQRELNVNISANSKPVRPGMVQQQQQQPGGRRERNWGDSVRELTRAILKFGEAYEQAESSKLHQVVEMEKQRMKFAKELELQRMQFFMKTQLELQQHRSSGNNNRHYHHHNHTNNNHDTNNNNNSNSNS